MDEPLTVALPLGIGDCHWALQKLRGLKAHHGNRSLHLHVNESPNHKTVEYLKMIPWVDEALKDSRAPYGTRPDEMPPNHRDVKYATLAGCRRWRGFTYICVPNGHLELGRPIARFWPDIPTDYTYEIDVPAEERARAAQIGGEGRLLLYPSGIGPNRGFHQNSWSPSHWAEVVRRLNGEGLVPTFMGAPTPDDLGYINALMPLLEGCVFDNLVGQSSMAVAMQMIKTARVWCGLNSGLGIVSASQSTPTVMLWSDDRYPIPGVGTVLHHGMQRGFLDSDQLEKYRTLSFGSPELTPERVVAAILEVIRCPSSNGTTTEESDS